MSRKDFGDMTKDTLATLDVDDFMAKINQLMIHKENLMNDCDNKRMEIGTWKQILQTTSMEDVREVVSDLPSRLLSPEETELVVNYSNLSKKAFAYANSDMCSGCLTEEGETILQFASPFTNTRYSVWLNTAEDGQYVLKHHTLPKTIPVNHLLQKYSRSKDGEVLKRFNTAISQYTWPIFHREHEAVRFEKIDTPTQNKYVYRNEDLTVMSFTVSINHNDKSTSYEFMLEFEIMDVLPYNVKTTAIKGAGHYPALEDFISDLGKEMKKKSFVDVVSLHLGREFVQDESSTSDAGSSDTIQFEIFK